MSPEVLASICKWQGDVEVFYGAMTKTYLDIVDGKLVAHEWGDINSQLVHNWTVGTKGGRPRKTQGLSLGIPEGKPLDNPVKTQGVTDREEKRRLDGEEKKTPSESAPSEKASTARLVTEEFLQQVEEEYSNRDADIRAEYVKAKQWILDNPGRQLTQAFFRNWLRKGNFPVKKPAQKWVSIAPDYPSIDELHNRVFGGAA